MKYILIGLILVLVGVLWFLMPAREGLDNPTCWEDVLDASTGKFVDMVEASMSLRRKYLMTLDDAKTVCAANPSCIGIVSGDAGGLTVYSSYTGSPTIVPVDVAPLPAPGKIMFYAKKPCQSLVTSTPQAPGCPTGGEGITSVKQSGGQNVRLYTQSECTKLKGTWIGNGARDWGMKTDKVGECYGTPGVNLSFCNQTAPPSPVAAVEAGVPPPTAPLPMAPPPAPAPAPPACWGNLVDAHSGSFISKLGEDSGMGALVTGPKYTTSADAQAACASDSTCTGVMKTKIPTGVGQQFQPGYIKYTGSPEIISRPGMMGTPAGEITFLPKIPCVSSAPPPPPAPAPAPPAADSQMGTLISLLQQDIMGRKSSLLNTANNPAVPVGSLLTQTTVDPNWKPVQNGTIPGPNFNTTKSLGPLDNVPKSSLVPCTCPTYTMSCPVHAGSMPSSEVPGDTISALAKAQDQYDIMRPFNNTEEDVPGFLTTFSAFG